jgi:hypothetical protein
MSSTSRSRRARSVAGCAPPPAPASGKRLLKPAPLLRAAARTPRSDWHPAQCPGASGGQPRRRWSSRSACAGRAANQQTSQRPAHAAVFVPMHASRCAKCAHLRRARREERTSGGAAHSQSARASRVLHRAAPTATASHQLPSGNDTPQVTGAARARAAAACVAARARASRLAAAAAAAASLAAKNCCVQRRKKVLPRRSHLFDRARARNAHVVR